MAGVLIGVDNLVYAKLVEGTDVVGGTPQYETPVRIPGAITANINPNSSVDTLFADDGPFDSTATTGQISLELNTADLPLEIQADLLGHVLENGILKRRANDVPPWVAIGFRSLKSNGHYRYTWLNKGKFGVPEQSNQTKGDSINWNTPTITGAFVKREADDEWERHADEDSLDYVPEIGATWFDSPLGPTGPIPALAVSSTVPADSATGVDTSTTIKWTFNNALMLSTVTTGNFLLQEVISGAIISGALTVDAARKVVTLTPASALDPSTDYRAIVTTSVKDIYGQSLSAAHITEFTTAP